jgi:hypothetical protein
MRPTETPLQEFQRAIADVILDARDTLDMRAYTTLIDWLCCVVARDAARFIGFEERKP